MNTFDSHFVSYFSLSGCLMKFNMKYLLTAAMALVTLTPGRVDASYLVRKTIENRHRTISSSSFASESNNRGQSTCHDSTIMSCLHTLAEAPGGRRRERAMAPNSLSLMTNTHDAFVSKENDGPTTMTQNDRIRTRLLSFTSFHWGHSLYTLTRPFRALHFVVVSAIAHTARLFLDPILSSTGRSSRPLGGPRRKERLCPPHVRRGRQGISAPLDEGAACRKPPPRCPSRPSTVSEYLRSR
jgi:hypothetical protein